MKKFVFVLLVILLVTPLIQCKSDSVSEDNFLINPESLMEKDEKIVRLEGKLSNLEERLENKILEMVDLKNQIKSLETKIASFESSEQMDTDKALEAQKDLEKQVNLAIANYELDLLFYDNKILRPGLSEEEVLFSFGHAQTNEIVVDDGSVISHQKGIYWKKVDYRDFLIVYLGDRQGENYKVHSFFTESDKLKTIKSIHVGSTVDDLLAAYPELIEEHLPNEDLRYAFPEDEYILSMRFKIKDNLISEIMYLGYH